MKSEHLFLCMIKCENIIPLCIHIISINLIFSSQLIYSNKYDSTVERLTTYVPSTVCRLYNNE